MTSARADSLVAGPEKLVYDIQWRLIHAGTAEVESSDPEGRIKLDSAGLVSTLFKVNDTYTVHYDSPYCATRSVLDAQEGKHHQETVVTFDRNQKKAMYVQRDLQKNMILHSDQIDIPSCIHDVLGGLIAVRGLGLEPGQSTQFPMTDGRRAAQVKVEAQERENVSTPAGSFKTVRYEADILNGVIYARKGKALIWVSDDSRRLPVQIRLRMNFPIGTVTLQLQRDDRQ